MFAPRKASVQVVVLGALERRDFVKDERKAYAYVGKWAEERLEVPQLLTPASTLPFTARS